MFSQKALQLILEEEGLDQPSEWPGGDSGITIGRGYDLGWETTFENDWKPYLLPEEIARLQTVVGLKGEDAEIRASEFKDIDISQQAADAVFLNNSLPSYIDQTRAAFPQFDILPFDAQGALVSIVYNRGASMDGDRRTEMRAIRALIPNYSHAPNGTLQGIADQIRSMERLWPDNTDVDIDLRNRRDHEAELVESCIATN